MKGGGEPKEDSDQSADWVPVTKNRSAGRRRALNSTRSKERAAGAVWSDGLVALPNAPGTLMVRGDCTTVMMRRIGPHGCSFSLQQGDAPSLGSEVHIGIPAEPIQTSLLTVVGTLVGTADSPAPGRTVVHVELSSHGGVPTAYWDLVTFWAESASQDA